MVVKPFDKTKREVLGNIELSVQVGPCTFNSKFIVMDINPSYNSLLGKSWIHMARVVPLTLHQKVKLVAGESLITMVVEEDMVAMTTVTTLYVKIKENAIKCSFRAFEVITATCAKNELEMLVPHLSQNT